MTSSRSGRQHAAHSAALTLISVLPLCRPTAMTSSARRIGRSRRPGMPARGGRTGNVGWRNTRVDGCRRGDPAATALAGQVPRCVAFRQIWCHVCAPRAKLPREAPHPRKPSPVTLAVPVKQAAPLARGAAAQHVMPGYQACTFFVSQGDRPLPGGLTWPDTPPAAGRAWVPGCRARTLRRPYHRSTTKSPA